MRALKIALFGGSFDPIHHAHLILAHDALEELALDAHMDMENEARPRQNAILADLGVGAAEM